MVKNQRGGKKHKRGKKLGDDTAVSKNIELAENGQEYAKVLARLGGARLEVECTDGKQRQAIIPGKFKKKIWMNPGDIVLVSIDAVGDNEVCSIDKKYNPKEVVALRQKGLITFEEDETENKNYEFKSAEDNIGKTHANIKEQPSRPSLDSDDDSDLDDAYGGYTSLNRPRNQAIESTKDAKPQQSPKSATESDSESSEEVSQNKQTDSPKSESDDKDRVYTLDDL